MLLHNNKSERDSLLNEDPGERDSLLYDPAGKLNHIFKAILASKNRWSKKRWALVLTASASGLITGVPWIKSASDAAVIFPAGLSRTIFEKIFAVGIVITAGIEGLWIIFGINHNLANNYERETNSLIHKNVCCNSKIPKIILSGILSFLSCIASAYATIKYNIGNQRYTAIITFLGDYAYGIFGYYLFLEKLANFIINWRFANKEAKPTRNTILRNVNNEISKENNITNIENISDRIFDLENLENTQKGFGIFKYFIMGFSVIISLSSSFVDALLTRAFLMQYIYNNSIFATTAAILFGIPDCMIAFASTNATLENALNSVFCRKSEDTLLKQMYSRCSRNIINIGLFLLSVLVVPTPAYITYTTLSLLNIPALQYIVTAFLIIARFCYTNYAQHCMADLLMRYIYKKRASEEVLEQNRIKENLVIFREVVTKTRLPFFNNFKRNNEQVETGYQLISQNTASKKGL